MFLNYFLNIKYLKSDFNSAKEHFGLDIITPKATYSNPLLYPI